MNHKEVMKKWLGKNFAETPELGFQCVAWSKKYCQERGYPIKWFGWSAWKWWVTGSPFDSSWKRVVKTPFNYPSEWDVIFWSEARCKYGHVWIANWLSNPALVRYSDQNWTGKWDKIQNRFTPYTHIVGWYTRIQ